MTFFSDKISIFTAKISDDFFSHRHPRRHRHRHRHPFLVILTRKTPFLLFSYFPAHPTTLLLKILGGRMHGSSPHLKVLGDRPPVPLGLRPCNRPTFVDLYRGRLCLFFKHGCLRRRKFLTKLISV